MNPLNLEICKALYPDTEIILWNRLFKRMKFHRIQSEMLVDGGHCIPCICRLDTDGTKTPQELRLVIFNRDYVIAKLAGELSEIKQSVSVFEWNNLMSSVYFHE